MWLKTFNCMSNFFGLSFSGFAINLSLVGGPPPKKKHTEQSIFRTLL